MNSGMLTTTRPQMSAQQCMRRLKKKNYVLIATAVEAEAINSNQIDLLTLEQEIQVDVTDISYLF